VLESERSLGLSITSPTTLIGSVSKRVFLNKASVRRPAESVRAHCWDYIQIICPPLERPRQHHPGDPIPSAFSPCLTLPQWDYYSQLCPLKRQSMADHWRQQSHLSTTPVVPQHGESIAPRANSEANSDTTHVTPQPQLPYMMPSPLAEVLVVPHDEVYESAKWHQCQIAPSPAVFSPIRDILRLQCDCAAHLVLMTRRTGELFRFSRLDTRAK